MKAKSNREGYEKIHQVYAYRLSDKSVGLFDINPSKTIAYSTIVSATNKLLKQNALLDAFMKKGWDALLQAYPVGRRDIIYPNQEWQADATKFDFMVKASDGSIKRLNYTIIIDSFSGAIVGRLTDTLNSYDQTRVLYDAVSKMGLPQVMRLDNGKDYTSEHYQSVLGLNECGVSFADVGQGRQKGKVERAFGYLQNSLALLPGYIGNDTEKRKMIENQTASKIDIRTSKATRIDVERLLSEEELRAVLENIVATRSKNYEAHTPNLLSQERLEEIYRTLGKREFRTLSSSGIVFNGITYTSVGIWLAGLCQGDKIEVRENIDDSNKIFVYKDDEFVTVAINKELEESMSIEDHKKAKKDFIAQNITPLSKKIRKAQAEQKAIEDEFTKELLAKVGITKSHVAYPKTTTQKANNSSVSSSVSKISNDDLDYFMKFA